MTDRDAPSDCPLPDTPDGVTIESATPADRLDVLRVLDAAMLDVDADDLDDRIAAGDVLVARAERAGEDRPPVVSGALVMTRPDPERVHVDAVAVRRARRGRGIGSALVAAAVRRAIDAAGVETVTAGFDASLREFYADLGFRVTADAPAASGAADRSASSDDDRLWGVVDGSGERRR